MTNSFLQETLDGYDELHTAAASEDSEAAKRRTDLTLNSVIRDIESDLAGHGINPSDPAFVAGYALGSRTGAVGAAESALALGSLQDGVLAQMITAAYVVKGLRDVVPVSSLPVL